MLARVTGPLLRLVFTVELSNLLKLTFLIITFLTVVVLASANITTFGIIGGSAARSYVVVFMLIPERTVGTAGSNPVDKPHKAIAVAQTCASSRVRGQSKNPWSG